MSWDSWLNQARSLHEPLSKPLDTARVTQNQQLHQTTTTASTRVPNYILALKFKDFSRTFKEPKVAFSRRKFTAWTALQ